ncbi:MAG: hypothetical protein WD425_11595, partial [Nitrospirales bacterium]
NSIRVLYNKSDNYPDRGGYHNDVNSTLMGRTWIYGKENELVEKQLVIENIAQVSLYIVGMSLLVKGFLRNAEIVFSGLDVDLEPIRRNNKSSPFLRQFCGKVRGKYVFSIAGQVQKEYMEIFLGQGMYHATSAEITNWLKRLDVAIRLNSHDARLYMLKGSILFLLEDVDAAFKTLRKAKDCAPRADPAPDLSSAFLYLFKGNIKKAKSLYRTALNKKGSYSMPLITHIVDFISQVLVRYPEKFQLHFALGLLNEERLDAQVALEEYEKFLKNSASDFSYSNVVPEVEQRVKGLKNKLRDKCS